MKRVRDRSVLRRSKARSKITNGTRLLAGIDGRSLTARRFRDLYTHYMQQTGGQHEELCKQLASLVLRRELLDAAQVRGEDIDTLHLVRLSNSISRTLKRLDIIKAKKTPDDERRRREREDREALLT